LFTPGKNDIRIRKTRNFTDSPNINKNVNNDLNTSGSSTKKETEGMNLKIMKSYLSFKETSLVKISSDFTPKKKTTSFFTDSTNSKNIIFKKITNE